jgi:hypothetical protein
MSRYAGRYVRRPPLAQYRIVEITNQEVRFWYKDKQTKRRLYLTCTLVEFVAMLAAHILDRYRHGIRHFGLLAPRSIAHTSTSLFLILGQNRRPRPKRLSWSFSLRRDFGIDPLKDSKGQTMKWIGRLQPHRGPF